MEENRPMILAGEIGATRTRLAAFDADGNKLQLVVEKTYLSQEHDRLPEITTTVMKTEGIPGQGARFGHARPVTAGRSKISDRPLTIAARELASQPKLNSVAL